MHNELQMGVKLLSQLLVNAHFHFAPDASDLVIEDSNLLQVRSFQFIILVVLTFSSAFIAFMLLTPHDLLVLSHDLRLLFFFLLFNLLLLVVLAILFRFTFILAFLHCLEEVLLLNLMTQLILLIELAALHLLV
jgi:hypothetical protein